MPGAQRDFEVHIIDKMDARFFDDNKPWTYLKGGKGANTHTRTYHGTNITGPGIDCSEFVHQSILASGYNVDYLDTKTMKRIVNDQIPSKYYSSVDDYDDIKVGDVLVFNNTSDNSGHAGVVRQYALKQESGSIRALKVPRTVL
jgi:cell wall-associated NlpC family hydrolase